MAMANVSVHPDVKSEKQPEVLAPIDSDSLEDGDVVDRKYEKALVRKLDLHLLPVLTLLYLLSFLDRSNGIPFPLGMFLITYDLILGSWERKTRGACY